MKKIHLALGLLGMLLLAACSPYSLVESTTYNNAQLQDYTTFHIVTPEEGKLPPGMTMVTYYNIAAAIREQMLDRGYTEDPSSPLLINIGLTIKKEVATEPLITAGPRPPFPYAGPFYHGVGPWFMYPRGFYRPGYAYNLNPNAQVVTGIYREGVLTMDMVNMQSKIALYSSSVATILDSGDTQFRNLEGIAQAVDVLFSKFPVPLLPEYRKGK